MNASSEFGVRDSEFGVRSSGFGVRDSEFGVRGSGFGVRGSGFGTGACRTWGGGRIDKLSVVCYPATLKMHIEPEM